MSAQQGNVTAPRETERALRIVGGWLIGVVLACILTTLFVRFDLSLGGRENEGQLGWIFGLPLAVMLASAVSAVILGRGSRWFVVPIVCPGLWLGAFIALLVPLAGLVVAGLGTAAGLLVWRLRWSQADVEERPYVRSSEGAAEQEAAPAEGREEGAP